MKFYCFVPHAPSCRFFGGGPSKKKKYFYPSVVVSERITKTSQSDLPVSSISFKIDRSKFYKGSAKNSLPRITRSAQTVINKGAPERLFKDYAGAFTYHGSKFKMKRKLHFKKTQKLRLLRKKLSRCFVHKNFSTFKRRVYLGFFKFNIPRSAARPLFVSRYVRKFRKFIYRARKVKVGKFQRVTSQKWRGKKKLRRRHPNIFTQLRARYNYFFTYFKLKSRFFGRRLGHKVGYSSLRRNFFANAGYKHSLLSYALTAPRLRQSFKYPYPLPLVTRFRRLGIMGRTFRHRANIILLTSKNFFRRKGKRRRTASKYLALNRYDAHRRYLRTLRRRGYRRNFIVYPPVGSVGRVARFSKRRYGSLLNFFVRRLRFKKLRRYIRLRRRKRRIVPILAARRRHRRIYQMLPLMFKKRSFSYVFIKQTTNNVFYSVFSRKKRLLANFSNGRTEFLGSKRMSTVASEAAAKVLLSYFAANRIRSVFFIFGSRFNHFMRAAVKVFRARRIKIAGFKYRMRKPHSLGLRKRASRRV